MVLIILLALVFELHAQQLLHVGHWALQLASQQRSSQGVSYL